MPRPVHRPVRRISGYTLLELLVVIIIIAVVAAIAFPNFQEMTNRNRLAGATNEVVATLQQAKIESIRRGARIVVCPSTNGTSCSATNVWTRHIAFVDTNRDGAASVGELIVRDSEIQAPVIVNASGAVTSNRIVFRPDGVARTSTGTTVLTGTIGVCIVTTRPAQNARLVAVSGSRVSVAAPLTSASCAAPI